MENRAQTIPKQCLRFYANHYGIDYEMFKTSVISGHIKNEFPSVQNVEPSILAIAFFSKILHSLEDSFCCISKDSNR